MTAALTGGFRVSLLGIPLSVRGEHRAALFAIIFIAAGLGLHAGARARLGGLLTGPRVLTAAGWVLSLVMLWIGLTYGTRAAAGSDVYGYVSQVPLWLSDTLHVPQPMAAEVPWPNADWTFSPLGLHRPLLCLGVQGPIAGIVLNPDRANTSYRLREHAARAGAVSPVFVDDVLHR